MFPCPAAAYVNAAVRTACKAVCQLTAKSLFCFVPIRSQLHLLFTAAGPWQGKTSRAQFSNWLCYEATSTCTQKPPGLPKDRKPGPAFEVADPQEAQLARMMDSMKVCMAPACAHSPPQ